MPRKPEIRLPGLKIPILHEDRAILAIDKPAGWQLAPETARRVANNLHALLMGSIIAGDRWASSRGLRFIRHVHRLDEETSGVLLLARSKGAIAPLSQCFADNQVDKVYLAIVKGQPKEERWISRMALLPFDRIKGRVVSNREGKPTETHFQLLASDGDRSLVACRPVTGRTHQIRVHLAESGYPIVDDRIYANAPPSDRENRLGLRAIYMSLRHPFTRKIIRIEAPWKQFVKRYGFDSRTIDFEPGAMTGSPPVSKRTPDSHGRQERHEKHQPEKRSQKRKGRGER
jgi:RluA family pseudouridine synthase